MAGPTEEHRDFFKGMHGNPERAQAFMTDPRKALEDAGLDSSVISDEHHEAITGGGHTVTTVLTAFGALGVATSVGVSVAAAL